MKMMVSMKMNDRGGMMGKEARKGMRCGVLMNRQGDLDEMPVMREREVMARSPRIYTRGVVWFFLGGR